MWLKHKEEELRAQKRRCLQQDETEVQGFSKPDQGGGGFWQCLVLSLVVSVKG